MSERIILATMAGSADMAEKVDSNAGYFLAGLVVGSLISIYFAPKSGEGTRTPIEEGRRGEQTRSAEGSRNESARRRLSRFRQGIG